MADAKPENLIVSLHIPKTGGTSFAAVLEAMFPSGVAYYYKPHNKLTHPGLKARELVRDPARLAELEAEGVRVVHGHMQAAWYDGLVPPERRWTWVRDPVERVISSYYYLKNRSRRIAEMPEDKRPRDKVGERTLEEYVRRRPNQNQQSRILAGAPLSDYGFVGITERFEESLTLLGLPEPRAEARNVNRSRPEVSDRTRDLIRDLNAADVALYQEALDLHARRMADRA